MAKKRRLASPPEKRSQDPPPRDPLAVDAASIALGLLGGAMVYLTYYPSDSVSVEKGDALWFGFIAIAMATVTWAGRTKVQDLQETGRTKVQDVSEAGWRLSLLIDASAWLLAVWMMIAAFDSSPPGNLRMATNEGWLWFSAAAMFTTGRRLLADRTSRQGVLLLMLVCASALAVHGMHQYFVSLPQQRIEYRENPERILGLVGLDAPEGSAERMVFENRLFDGGPTGTFALANSLAAVLLAGAIVSLSMLRMRWRSLSVGSRATWAIVLLLCVGCLMAARSRSASLALVLAAVVVFVFGSAFHRTRPRVLLGGLIGIACIAGAGSVWLAMFGNPEWFEQAPASLAFRFQYWRSTLAMVFDRPLFGAGPGNFQSIYERYREPSATEQVAEPHNFIFETWASGGFVALVLLIVLVVCVIVCAWPRLSKRAQPSGEPAESTIRWLWLGAGLSLAMIWLIGFATRMMPDLDAHLLAVPVAVFLAIVLWPSLRSTSCQDLDLMAGTVLLAVTIHLTVSGGWTVPGVAVLVWLLAAMLTRKQPLPSPANANAGGSNLAAKVGLVSLGVILLAAIYFMSIKPVQVHASAMLKAQYAQQRGQIGRATALLEHASAADPWSVDALLWLADLHRRRLVSQRDTPAVRESWEAALAEVLRRGGDSPALYRTVGAQQLHLYQRYGVVRDLDAATETFRQAARWSPANQWMAAQVAVIAQARGELELAEQTAKQALFLSKLGGNIERALPRQQIYVCQPLGQVAKAGPIRRPADRLLANHIDSGGVDPD